ncbi:MAG: cyclic nucleotide-binding domain-containing protein [Candidatus Eisenbacteria bacterium]
MLTTIERVILLRRVDVFTGVPTEKLAELAAVSEEVDRLEDDVLFREGDPSDALYLVIHGEVRLTSQGQWVADVGPEEAIGTWALFDDEPRIATATVTRDARLLRIRTIRFQELLSDHTEIAQAVLRTLARRFRSLARTSLGDRGESQTD